MKILFINTFYYPNMAGGAEFFLKDLIEFLNPRHECAIFSIYDMEKDMKGKNTQIDFYNGVKIYKSSSGAYSLNARRNASGSSFTKIRNKILDINNPIAIRNFRKVLAEFQPDIIHSQNVLGIGPKVWKIAYENEIPCILTVHDLLAMDSAQATNPILYFPHRIIQYYYQRYSKYLSAVVTPSKIMYDRVAKLHFSSLEKLHCISNATTINVDVAKIIQEKKSKRNKITRFIYVGALLKHKGILKLIEAFSSIKDDKIQLTLCGKGALEKEVRTKIQNDTRIQYKGWLNTKELNVVFLQQDVLMAPSLIDESFGLTVIEGAKYGLPTIGSNKGGIKETIDKTGFGETYPSDDISALRKKIIDFSSFSYREQFFQPILEHIYDYSLDKMADAYEQLYENELKK